MSSSEPYRPQFHFSPTANWLNDPNGLVYYAGEYHLFYQYHPDSTEWGPMHWGHAVSTNLVRWEELPIALYPDEIGAIFSGSAVIDWHNTAGFGAEAMVAIFTHHVDDGHLQSQSIAFSLDRGRTWRKYAGNPVLPTPPGQRDFRDPKVLWYGHEDTGHWVMCLAVGREVHFYTSPNLIEWRFSSAFGGQGAAGGVWECPDLFVLPVDGVRETRWVLLVGVGAGAPAGGSGQQYFVGRFDGRTFTNEHTKKTILWADYGADCYAMQSWSDVTDGRRLAIGWMNNWDYARQIPTHPWRGAMTLVRELTLVTVGSGKRLQQHPVAELALLRLNTVKWENRALTPGQTWDLPLPENEVAEIEVCFAGFNADVYQCKLRICFPGSSNVEIRYAPAALELQVDRSASGETGFADHFAAVHAAPLSIDDGKLRLHLFLDRSSLEVFAQDGLLLMTEQIFPPDGPAQLQIESAGGAVTVESLTIYSLLAGRERKSPP